MNSILHSSKDASLAPRDFLSLCSPSWARVYIELSYGRDPSQDRLSWDSESVRKEFICLTGFDPAKLQFGEFHQQHAALNIARELDSALYQADEVEQLDGAPALQFASGWLSCYIWIYYADKSLNPTEDEIDREAKKASSTSVDVECFLSGYKHRAGLGGKFVA